MQVETPTKPTVDVVNIAAYKFVPLTDLEPRRERLRTFCRDLGLKGTIMLSPEGINLFLAGTRPMIDAVLCELQRDTEIGTLEVKESLTDYQPFSRMLVKLKREIIAFGIDGVEPLQHTSPKLPASQLKQWLDEGRAVTLLDVRNDFEVELGTFEEQIGFRNIYQLEGGILKYFEECGQQHYQGDCFVFDKRVAVDSQLRETDAALCFACQKTLTVEDQASPHYVPGESCPYCLQVVERTSAEG